MSFEPVFVASELSSLPSVKLLVNVQIGGEAPIEITWHFLGIEDGHHGTTNVSLEVFNSETPLFFICVFTWFSVYTL